MAKNVSVDTKSTQENISMHTQIISQRITQKINEIGRKTHALKQKENAFYAEAKKESRRNREFLDTDKLRDKAYNKFKGEWKKIDDGKDEVDWLIYRLYVSIEDEEEK